LACDLRYAAETAIFTTAFARVAFAGDYGGTWFLTRLVGPAKAKELYYFSERLTADQAEKLGLVNAVFPAGELEKEVMDRARRLAEGPSIAHRYMNDRPPLHEREPQPGGPRQPRGMHGPRGHTPHPYGPDRRPPGSGAGVRGEEGASVPRPLTRRCGASGQRARPAPGSGRSLKSSLPPQGVQTVTPSHRGLRFISAILRPLPWPGLWPSCRRSHLAGENGIKSVRINAPGAQRIGVRLRSTAAVGDVLARPGLISSPPLWRVQYCCSRSPRSAAPG